MNRYHLALDKEFSPYNFSVIEFDAFTFSGGEPHIKIKTLLNPEDMIYVSHRINSFNDLGMLCIAVDALRRMGIVYIEAFIPYFPAARQDRVMVTGEPLTVKVYAQIINNLNLNKVVVFDPHSDVTPALLDRVSVISNYDFIKEVLSQIPSNVYIVSPDGGALKKVYKLAEAIGHNDIIECSKHRNVETGRLTDFKVGSGDLEGLDCLIVDDICDGGGTFIGLAAELKKKNAGKLYLAISHGIFSQGLDELSKHFEMIFCTDSVKNLMGDNLEQIKLKL